MGGRHPVAHCIDRRADARLLMTYTFNVTIINSVANNDRWSHV